MTSTNKNTTATTSPFFHTARELAAFLGVDPVTVRRLMRRRAIPFIKLHGVYLFRKDEIDAFLERHTVHAVGMKRERMA
jgi:excisionase family DNA binding protein